MMSKAPATLVMQHVEWEGPGIVGSSLRDRKGNVDLVRLYKNEPIPFEKVERHVYGIIVALGSPSTSYLPDTNIHHEHELDFFRLIRSLRIPSFNVCYSMQMFCVAHGGTVAANPAGKEVGFFDVKLTPEGKRDPVFGGVGDFRTLQWHGDIVTKLPEGAVHLARSSRTKYQIAVADQIHYLFQGDGQAATPQMIRSWFENDGTWALQGSGANKDSVIREANRKQAYFASVYTRIFKNFLKNAERQGQR